MTDLKFASPSGETTIKLEGTGRLGTVAPKTQLHIKMDEPVQYETPMTEIEEVKAQLKVLEKKLSFLEELEKTKSPVEEAFKDWMGVYPPTNPSVDNIFDIRWRAFQMGYNAAYEEKVSEEPVKNKMPLYYRFREFGYLIPDSEGFCKIVKDFLMDEGVIEDESGEYITFTLQKYLLDTPNV
jgi:hypothetical protein